jgi:hypothetical protein
MKVFGENTPIKQKVIKVEWCENWLKKTFKKLPEGMTGIERNLLFKMAEQAGLYIKGTYGSPLSQALSNLVTVHYTDNYSYFQLKG